ncbi:MAG: hypothetical protein KF893_19010 [Caldilineaceae bacterium]|nr:hypothetical protein [Caldilineaceae bacterium]
MTVNVEYAHSLLESKVAEKYRQQGFDVVLSPQPKDLPFDLGNYRPDLLVKKSADEGYIIEIKRNAESMPIERYREIAEIIAQHEGWRFLLVTGDDVFPVGQDDGGVLSWEQIRYRQKSAEGLLSFGEMEGAFFISWRVLEALLRRQAQQVLIPIERLSALSLINHLYSQGELSMAQFDKARSLLALRNRLVYGYQAPDLREPTTELHELVNELLSLWHVEQESDRVN